MTSHTALLISQIGNSGQGVVGLSPAKDMDKRWSSVVKVGEILSKRLAVSCLVSLFHSHMSRYVTCNMDAEDTGC